MAEDTNQIKFNAFSFISTFARSLIEIFISLYLFKNGFNIRYVLLFYTMVNFFGIVLSYLFVKMGEKYNYSLVMIIGITGFLILQIVLNSLIHSIFYILFIALLYAIYRRGYWVSRRFYISSIMPKKESSKLFSVVLILTQISSILAGYVGAIALDNYNYLILTIISCILLFASIIPLMNIKISKKKNKIDLIKNIKKYNKKNLLAFTSYELNNAIEFLFPIYVAMYIKNNYMVNGTINAISNVAVIIFVFIYGKLINKDKNYFTICTILLVVVNLLKLYTINYSIFILTFFAGMVTKAQTQSLNKIYFEDRENMDVTNYTLMYNIIECFARMLVAIPLFFTTNIRLMIVIILIIINIQLLLYINLKNKKE